MHADHFFGCSIGPMDVHDMSAGILADRGTQTSAMCIASGASLSPTSYLKMYSALSGNDRLNLLPIGRGICLVLGDPDTLSQMEKELRDAPDVRTLPLGPVRTAEDIHHWVQDPGRLSDGIFYGQLCQCTDIPSASANLLLSGIIDLVRSPQDIQAYMEKSLFGWASSQLPHPNQLKTLCLRIVFEADRILGASAGIDCCAYSNCLTLSSLRRVFENDMKAMLGGVSQSAIHKAIDITYRQLSTPITRSDVAEMVGLSPSYFSRLFKKETGQSYTEFLLGARMQEATRLLHTTQLKVYEIAERVGIDSYRHFTVLYKRYTGGNPSDARQRKGL